MRNKIRSVLRRYASAPVRIDGVENLRASGPNQLVPPILIRGELEVGRYSTFGGNNRVFGRVSVGRYCQVGPFVSFYATDHPSSQMTTYVNSMLFGGRLKGRIVSAPISVGNDVWVGHGAVILKGVTIGDGAVIGAGAVVTQQVDPFEIVAGNPARSLRKRFTPEARAVVADLRWWELDPEQLLPYEALFAADLDHPQEHELALIRSWATARRGGGGG